MNLQNRASERTPASKGFQVSGTWAYAEGRDWNTGDSKRKKGLNEPVEEKEERLPELGRCKGRKSIEKKGGQSKKASFPRTEHFPFTLGREKNWSTLGSKKNQIPTLKSGVVRPLKNRKKEKRLLLDRIFC